MRKNVTTAKKREKIISPIKILPHMQKEFDDDNGDDMKIIVRLEITIVTQANTEALHIVSVI